MALDKAQLAANLKTTFKSAKDNSWTSDQVADALADAINTFLLTADVNGIKVNVVNNANVAIGTGTQTVAVKLQ